jgi:dihydropteroate synthase
MQVTAMYQGLKYITLPFLQPIMPVFTLNCRDRLLVILRPAVMGILNLTPDSFYDGGKYANETSMLRRVEDLLREGAAIIDVGAQSTRPGATLTSETEELQRLLPAIRSIRKNFPDAFLSVDTFRSNVAAACIEEGAAIVNDISGGQEDERIFAVAAHHHCPLVLMHRAGNFKTMHRHAEYRHFLSDILDYFVHALEKARLYGVKDIIIDPGFGFSKSLHQNYYLLKNLKTLQLLDRPILAGISRKSMLYKPTGTNAAQALNATTAAHMIALQNGASVLRAHDVKEAMECIRIFELLMDADDL